MLKLISFYYLSFYYQDKFLALDAQEKIYITEKYKFDKIAACMRKIGILPTDPLYMTTTTTQPPITTLPPTTSTSTSTSTSTTSTSTSTTTTTVAPSCDLAGTAVLVTTPTTVAPTTTTTVAPTSTTTIAPTTTTTVSPTTTTTLAPTTTTTVAPTTTTTFPVIACGLYTIATTAASGQTYTYIDCEGLPQSGNIGGVSGFDSQTFCAQENSVVGTGQTNTTYDGPCLL
jgi:hypothetical protein